ncbi:DUF5612 domain-containing protein [Methanococcus voltae]|uniref:Energy-converting hydrogenase B subunit Q n=2 Tax=Methanococcus voltae TaxID=2188 RepID=A0A8J7S1I2_METVO|nr:DUF5612 domain-containing protein [Methanococcus voltae]MBP2172925.1 energy-converting hydrogenase B subunit Q [Methanococcus voltae]MBP2201665.1 energy-converting hydrogenase B subunit Q [Methanococcus voltae]MCS3922453.1 energy-converting hydrogenase B subunit Q [Methanococcus voltae PS]
MDKNELGLSIETDVNNKNIQSILNIIKEDKGCTSYIHEFKTEYGKELIHLEAENLKDIEKTVSKINNLEFVHNVEVHDTMDKIFGKRVIIFGGGSQVTQVAIGAISEADRHNIRGERISIDTIPIVGEEELYNAILAFQRLPRAGVLVLAGSLMGGKITEAVKLVKENTDLPIISLNMFGSVVNHVDIVVSDPVQAGVLAVMTIASTAKFDITRINKKLI